MTGEQILKNLETEALHSLFSNDINITTSLCNDLLTQSILENNKYYEASSYGILGYMHYEAENFSEAIKFLLKAISISNLGERGFIDTGHLSLCYSKLNDLENSLFYVNKAIDVAQKLNHHPAKYEWFNFKANILFKLKRIDEAIDYVEKSINEIQFLISTETPKYLFYMPYLTKYEICLTQELTDEYISLENELCKTFDNIQYPIMHIKRDKIKFEKLLKEHQKLRTT